MTAVSIRGDAAHLPLPDESVDLIVTSPPYWALRSYEDGGRHYSGQLGSEATPGEYIAALTAATREWMRVLKPGGSAFINLGDKYAGSGGFAPDAPANIATPKRLAGTYRKDGRTPDGYRAKSLLLLPERYAIACADDLGLTVRRDIIWSKPNGLPESVTDRCRTSHEYLFHLVKQPRYYAAVDEIREPHQPPSGGRGARVGAAYLTRQNNGGGNAGNTPEQNPLGKLPGSVWIWDIPSQPLTGPECRLVWDGVTERWFGTWAEGWEHMRRLAGVLGRADRAAHRGRPSLRPEVEHFAAFPMELPRRAILGWSPPGVCTVCGEGRRPVVDRERRNTRPILCSTALAGAHDGDERRAFSRGETDATITGYACACSQPDAPTRPAVVLDPCGGTGTVAAVAAAYGRIGVTVDRSGDYARFARWRTSDPAQTAMAGERPRPPRTRVTAPPDGQGVLL